MVIEGANDTVVVRGVTVVREIDGAILSVLRGL